MNKQILKGMAKAFFACAYAEQAEETGEPLRGEIMEQLPPIPDECFHAARTLYMDFERALGMPLDGAWVFLHGIESMPDREDETFGHYAAIQAMGHGVGLWEYCPGSISKKVPYVEFGSYSLAKDYFSHKLVADLN